MQWLAVPLGTASLTIYERSRKKCFSPWMIEGAKDSPLLREVGGVEI